MYCATRTESKSVRALPSATDHSFKSLPSASSRRPDNDSHFLVVSPMRFQCKEFTFKSLSLLATYGAFHRAGRVGIDSGTHVSLCCTVDTGHWLDRYKTCETTYWLVVDAKRISWGWPLRQGESSKRFRTWGSLAEHKAHRARKTQSRRFGGQSYVGRRIRGMS